MAGTSPNASEDEAPPKSVGGCEFNDEYRELCKPRPKLVGRLGPRGARRARPRTELPGCMVPYPPVFVELEGTADAEGTTRSVWPASKRPPIEPLWRWPSGESCTSDELELPRRSSLSAADILIYSTNRATTVRTVAGYTLLNLFCHCQSLSRASAACILNYSPSASDEVTLPWILQPRRPDGQPEIACR